MTTLTLPAHTGTRPRIPLDHVDRESLEHPTDLPPVAHPTCGRRASTPSMKKPANPARISERPSA